MSRIRSSSFILAITVVGGIGSLTSACGSSDSGLEFGVPTNDDVGDAGSTGEVVLPPNDDGADGGVTSETPPEAKCVASSADLGTVCIHVKRAAAGPPIDDVSKALGIDGIGALVVMLMPDPWVKTSAPVVLKMFPSPSSGKDSFDVHADLPKTADLDVKPGKYFPFAVFYDQPGFATRQIDVGDYVPKMSGDWVIPTVEIVAGGAIDLELDLYPLRAMNVNVALAPSVHPVGSGTGPLAAAIMSAGTTTDAPKAIGVGSLPCADVVYGKPVVHVLTTAQPSGPGGYDVRVGLFDFAAGPDDPTVDPSILPPPPGAIVNYDGTRAPQLVLGDGWVTGPLDATLDHVVPFVDLPPTDPTPNCTAYGAAPK
jgi:hypothetical protein